MNTRLYVVWVGNGEKLKWQSDIPSPMKNNGAVNKTFIIFFLAPRVEMKQFKEKQIFFVKKEVKENEIHTYKLLLKSRFYLKRKKSNNQYVNYAPTNIVLFLLWLPLLSLYKNPIISLTLNQAEISTSQDTLPSQHLLLNGVVSKSEWFPWTFVTPCDWMPWGKPGTEKAVGNLPCPQLANHF